MMTAKELKIGDWVVDLTGEKGYVTHVGGNNVDLAFPGYMRCVPDCALKDYKIYKLELSYEDD